MKTINTLLSIFVAVFVIACVAGVAVAYFSLLPQTVPGPGAISLSPTPTTAPSPSGVVISQPGVPTRLVIPSINVDAPVIQLGLTAKGSVDAPKTPEETSWYKLGPRPGQQGSAVITGHYGTWQNGAHSVFDDLLKLKAGDTIRVTDDKGQTFSFAVVHAKTYDANAIVPEIFNKNDGTYLNLITCNGDWVNSEKTFNKRLVVFAKLAD